MENDTKPLLLIFPFNLLSHYLRCLELAKHLKQNFEIHFSYSSSYHSFTDKEGYQSFNCSSLDAERVMQCARKFDFSWMNEKDLLLVFESQDKVIREKKPFAVLGDTSPTLKMAAEKNGVKYISLMNGYMSKYYAYTRKISRTHPAYKFSDKLPAPVFDFITRIAESLAFKHVHQPFKKIRKLNGLKNTNNYLAELEGDLNLICDLEELFPQKNLPNHYITIPPLFYNPQKDREASIKNLDKSKRTIFISMGSTGDWEKVRFLNEDYFGQYNIITASDQFNVLNRPDIIKLPFVNFHNIFPQVDLVICHGGNGTIYQALYYGIPVLGTTTHFEQEWNMHGLERLGVGKCIDKVKEPLEYKNLVSEWVKKKGEAQLQLVKKRILDKINELHEFSF